MQCPARDSIVCVLTVLLCRYGWASSTDLRRQLEYIMRQYRGEGVDGAASDSEDADEDAEDTEVRGS